MAIVDRIKEIIKYKRISTRKFCLEIEVANGFFDKVKDVGSQKVLKILDKYPEINPEWLITGRGEMLREVDKNSVNQIIGDNNIQAGNNSKVDARQYYSDSPDVLRAQIEEKDRLLQEKEERIKEKDVQIKEKDVQIKEKDVQINKLLSILSNKYP